MRIAVSGTHGVGKTSLVAALVRALPGHAAVAEPYVALLEEGHAFEDPPTVEDFEAQLERSIQSLLELDGDAVFDRCPADFLAYLAAHNDRAEVDLAAWLSRAREALAMLDLVVHVPLEGKTGTRLQRRVDEHLQEILIDDAHGFGLEVVAVRGEVEERVRGVLGKLGMSGPAR